MQALCVRHTLRVDDHVVKRSLHACFARDHARIAIEKIDQLDAVVAVLLEIPDAAALVKPLAKQHRRFGSIHRRAKTIEPFGKEIQLDLSFSP